MDEYIEREALMAKLDEEVKFYISDRTLKGNFAAGVLCDMRDGTIAKFPAADVEPVRHGRWIFGELGPIGCDVNCSECGCGAKNVDPILWLNYDGHKHCGCCGAKMDGGEDDENT